MSETIAEQVAEVLDEHSLSSGGRNLGQYRTEWTCDCGETWITDGHQGESCKSGNDQHLAEQVQRVVDARYAEVWDEGWGAAADEMHPSGPKASRTPNPYRDAEEGA